MASLRCRPAVSRPLEVHSSSWVWRWGAERGWNVPREAGCPQGQAAGSDVFRSSALRESVIRVSFGPRSSETVLGF